MEHASVANSKYYFDVVDKQWWVLPPGHSEWKCMPLEEAEELGLHDAVLSKHCTFVDSTIDDYKAAVSTVESSLDHCASVKATVEPVPAKHSPRVSKEDKDGTCPITAESIPFGASSTSISINGSESPAAGSARSHSSSDSGLKSHLGKSISRLQEELSNTLEHLDSEDKRTYPADWGNMDTNSSINSVTGRSNTTSSAVLGNQLTNLMESSSAKKSLTSSSAPPNMGKRESFVRSAVRHATIKNNGAFGDFIRDVAAERERMQKQASTSEAKLPGERYQKMIDRARTLAAISMAQDDEPLRVKTSGASHESLIRDLRMEVMGDDIGDDTPGVAFDLSSDSDGSAELVQSDSLKSLMSQRMSLRRGVSNVMNDSAA
ncbi:hypothetical protein BaOVIS_003750 [Babesia ovis]|uniref:Uncharacterized protein n=1 Tax=Babesia ovis TaxID=5869 RepID=A0A9W5T920_BABOV|nr:hypothetical protein BaOVIS_003750 [Babesia ovis]